MTAPVLLYADRLPPLVGGMEMHARYFIEYFQGHSRFPLAGIVTKGAAGADRRLLDTSVEPAIVFFNSGRWIEELPAIRAKHPGAIFAYRTGGNEIVKAPLSRVVIPEHAARQAFWAATLNATLDVLVTNSAFTEGRLRAVGVTCRFERCVGGVNVRALPPKRPRTANPLTLFCAARFVPYKHHDRLVNLVAELVTRGMDLRLRLAGDGPLGPLVREQVQRLELADRVTFLGVLDNEAACVETAAADAYVQLSADVHTEVTGGRYVHAEGMGRSILEALSAGTYVVAGRGGALSEVITPDRGILLNLDLPDVALAEELRPVLADPPRPPPTDAYAWERVFARYERIWEDLLAATCRH